jgi:hypothetical protein
LFLEILIIQEFILKNILNIYIRMIKYIPFIFRC